jgi:hypothetical protein
VVFLMSLDFVLLSAFGHVYIFVTFFIITCTLCLCLFYRCASVFFLILNNIMFMFCSNYIHSPFITPVWGERFIWADVLKTCLVACIAMSDIILIVLLHTLPTRSVAVHFFFIFSSSSSAFMLDSLASLPLAL